MSGLSSLMLPVYVATGFGQKKRQWGTLLAVAPPTVSFPFHSRHARRLTQSENLVLHPHHKQEERRGGVECDVAFATPALYGRCVLAV